MSTPYFTDVYRKFTDVYHRNVVEEDDPAVPEKVVRCVWNDQLFKTSELHTTEGKPLTIVFPGYWNFGSGPDFKNATIRVGDLTLEGDIELHVYGTDWKSHGHSENNEYDNVILHVFMWKSRGKKNSDSKNSFSRPHIDELELKSFLKDGILKLNDELDFDSYPLLNQFNCGLCHGPLSRLPKEKLEHLLNTAGQARIQVKMDRYHNRIITHGYEQAFYEGIAEALGYPNNKKPFKALAECVEVASLLALASEQKTERDSILTLQAILFGVSGLLEEKFPAPSELKGEDKKYTEALNRIWKQHRPKWQDDVMSPTEWKFGKMRPANFPYRRIAALSHLIWSQRKEGVFQNYIKNLKSTVSISQEKGYTTPLGKRLLQYFCLEVDDYWANHYTPGGKKLQSNQQLIGADRSREITINIALPICLIYARASRDEALEALLGRLFQTQNRVADNQWIRFMKQYILGNEPSMLSLLKSDQQTQGLMQVYQDFCTKNKNNCLRCEFPGVVEHYFS